MWIIVYPEYQPYIGFDIAFIILASLSFVVAALMFVINDIVVFRILLYIRFFFFIVLNLSIKGQPGDEINRKAMESDYFWELKDMIGFYPNLSSIPDHVITAALYKGGLYGLPRLRDQARGGIIVRKDWMETLGLEEPKDMDDLYEIIKAMTTQDPDGNGKDDTYGFNYRHTLWGFPIMAAWYGAGADWSFRDGEIIRNHETQEFMNALKWGRRLNEEGLFPKYHVKLKKILKNI